MCRHAFDNIHLQPLEPGEVNELAKVTSVCGIPRTAECVSIMK